MKGRQKLLTDEQWELIEPLFLQADLSRDLSVGEIAGGTRRELHELDSRRC